ncbi:hypothetical protein SDC9_157283 [bioreactor metagenome]|uniref:Uncharacterized protein n=1 Tax=bioreactor metagenome TaxID=1076179 RepID=A0A645F7W3_9ZZZZ
MQYFFEIKFYGINPAVEVVFFYIFFFNTIEKIIFKPFLRKFIYRIMVKSSQQMSKLCCICSDGIVAVSFQIQLIDVFYKCLLVHWSYIYQKIGANFSVINLQSRAYRR